MTRPETWSQRAQDCEARLAQAQMSLTELSKVGSNSFQDENARLMRKINDYEKDLRVLDNQVTEWRNKAQQSSEFLAEMNRRAVNAEREAAQYKATLQRLQLLVSDDPNTIAQIYGLVKDFR